MPDPINSPDDDDDDELIDANLLLKNLSINKSNDDDTNTDNGQNHNEHNSSINHDNVGGIEINRNQTTTTTHSSLINWMDVIEIEKFWLKQREKFIKLIYPNFFIHTLIKFQIFTDNDLNEYQNILNCDLDNSSERLSCYEKLNSWMFAQLLNKIRENTNNDMNDNRILIKIIESLRYDDWYTSMADEWEQQLVNLTNSYHNDNNNNTNYFNFDQYYDNYDKQKSPSSISYSKKFFKKLFINFPQPISYKIDRKSKLMEIDNHLDELLKNGKGMLVIYGPKGSGKTILAETSIRQTKSKYFDDYDRNYWITIGNLTKTNNKINDRDEIFYQELYNRFELLYQSIEYANNDKNSNSMNNILQPKHDRLDNIVLLLNHYFADNPKSLLVLDDVQTSEIFKFIKFDDIPIIITTYDRGIIPKELDNVKFVSTMNKNGNILSIEECNLLLKNCLNENNIDSKYFNDSVYLPQLYHIIDYYPYCIPLIANYMLPFIENYTYYDDTKMKELENHWKHLYEILTNDDDNSSSLRTNGKLLLDLTIEAMNGDDKLIDCFYDFGIFPEPVSFNVLLRIWNLNRFDTAKIIRNLSQKSLIKKQSMDQSKQDITNEFFSVHDLTASYLIKKLSDHQLKRRHEKIVDAYLKDCKSTSLSSKSCDYDLTHFQNDPYIYRCLSYHIYSSGRFDLFPKIFLDLNFLQKKIHYIGKSHVLGDYHNYGQYFQNDEMKLKDYRKFISSNIDVCDPNVDLLQLALCQSNDTIVYNDAKQLINYNTNFYFDWCNKQNFVLENQHKKMSFKCFVNTTWASLSPNPYCKCIITVNDCQLNLWNANTGEKICSEKDHHRTINHCTFSPDGQYILTTSDDGRAIVWQMTGSPLIRKNLMTNNNHDRNHVEGRRRHNSGRDIRLINYKTFVPNSSKYKSDAIEDKSNSLKYGDISADNRFILLGNDNGFIFIFSMEQQQLYSSSNIDNMQSDVKCCSFSPDNAHFLFLIHNIVYIYSMNINSNQNSPIRFHRDNNLINPKLLKKLVHNNAAHNAVFNPKKSSSSNKLTIFTSCGKNILQWKMRKNRSRYRRILQQRNNEIDEVNCSFRYSLPENASGYLSICAISSDGKLLAGFETTRNEIYLWKRKQAKSYNCFHALSTIIKLNFSSYEECLIALNTRNEITIWDLSEGRPITSVVEIKDDFAAICDLENGSLKLNILTIDKKGFLRLFNDKNGLEDKIFKENLKENIENFFNHKNNNFENDDECDSSEKKIQILLTPSRPSINIVCCDILDKNQFIFGTDCGRIFYYNYPNNTLLSSRYDSSEIVYQCKFLPISNDDSVYFITVLERIINFYRLDNEIDQLINCHTYFNNYIEKDYKYELIHIISNKLIIFATNNSDFIIFNYETMEGIYDHYSPTGKITDIDSYPCDNSTDYLILITFAQNTILLLQLIENKIIESKSIMKLVNEVPRSCLIGVNFYVIGCDSGNIHRIDDEQFKDNQYHLPNNSKWIKQHAPNSWINFLRISSDQRYLISAADSIKLWHTSDGTLLQTFITHGTISRLFVNFGHNHYNNDDTDNYSMNRNIMNLSSSTTSSSLTTTTTTQMNDENNLYVIDHRTSTPSSLNQDQDESLINLTIVAITDSKSLYILQNYRLNNSN